MYVYTYYIFSSDEDEDKYVDKMDMPGTKVDAAERYTVRNLRIREDTAKYLRNLDPNSAYYDPKTRAMRKNPYENTGKFNLYILYNYSEKERVNFHKFLKTYYFENL